MILGSQKCWTSSVKNHGRIRLLFECSTAPRATMDLHKVRPFCCSYANSLNGSFLIKVYMHLLFQCSSLFKSFVLEFFRNFFRFQQEGGYGARVDGFSAQSACLGTDNTRQWIFSHFSLFQTVQASAALAFLKPFPCCWAVDSVASTYLTLTSSVSSVCNGAERWTLRSQPNKVIQS